MRIRTARWGLSAAVLVTAGLTLTACGTSKSDSGSSPSASGATSSTTGPAADDSPTAGATSGSSSSAGSGSGTGGSSAAGAACSTANLSFSSSGGADGEMLINLKNVGSTTCSMHGFPGVDLKSQYGTVHAARSTMTPSTVTVSPGQTTNFVLHYPVNNTGGSGLTFRSLVVTPPNETHSHTMNVGINIPADSNSMPTITVGPVGAGK